MHGTVHPIESFAAVWIAAIVGNEPRIIVIGVQRPCDRQLPMIADTTRPCRRAFRLRQGWKKQARKNADDRNDNQEFDQAESMFSCSFTAHDRTISPSRDIQVPAIMAMFEAGDKRRKTSAGLSD